MALVGIDTILRRVSNLLRKLEPPQGVEILSYKRNRGVTILLLEDNRVLIRERGYEEQEIQVDLAGVTKTLKSILKREFPRSRKLRLYNVAGPQELDVQRKKL